MLDVVLAGSDPRCFLDELRRVAPALPIIALTSREQREQTVSSSGQCYHVESDAWWKWRCGPVEPSTAVWVDHGNRLVDYLSWTDNGRPPWFQCRAECDYHGVGDRPWRWLWTQGDSGHWGWVKDGDIISDTEPVPVC